MPHTHLGTWTAGVCAASVAPAVIASSLAGLAAGRAGAPSMTGLVAGMPAQQVSATCLGTCGMDVVAARHWHCFADICSEIPSGRWGQQHRQAVYLRQIHIYMMREVDARCEMSQILHYKQGQVWLGGTRTFIPAAVSPLVSRVCCKHCPQRLRQACPQGRSHPQAAVHSVASACASTGKAAS